MPELPQIAVIACGGFLKLKVMTTKDEALNEFKQFLEDKRQEYSDEVDDEAMQWQEDADQPESEYYEIAKKEYDEILKRKGEIDDLLDNIENLLINQ